MFPRNGSIPASLPDVSGVAVPVPGAGEARPLTGLMAPDGGTGILMSSGLPGTSREGRSGMWILFALLL